MNVLNYDIETSNEIIDYYINNNVGYSEICLQCRAYAKKKGTNIKNGPMPFFHIGKNFNDGNIRPLFIGIVAYGWEGELGNTFFNSTQDERRNNKQHVIHSIEDRIDDLFFHKRKFHADEHRMRFFSYLRSATHDIFGTEGYSKIALTNLLKCNNGAVRSKDYPLRCFDYCIRSNFAGNLMKDIEILNPSHVILLTKNHNRYYRYLKLIEAKGIKTITIAHPSSNKAGTIDNWSAEIKSFLLNN